MILKEIRINDGWEVREWTFDECAGPALHGVLVSLVTCRSLYVVGGGDSSY